MNTDWQLDAQDYAERLNHIDTILPPCPRCGGDGYGIDSGGMGGRESCPDCPEHPGKASIEQVVATYNAVHDKGGSRVSTHLGGEHVINHLRSVKP